MDRDKLRRFLNDLSVREQTEFAWACGTTIGYLRKRISDNGTIGMRIASAIDKHSLGAVTVEDLCDVDINHLRGRRRRSAA